MSGVLVRKGTMASEHVPQGCYVKTCTETEAMQLQAKDCQRLLRTTTGQEGRREGRDAHSESGREQAQLGADLIRLQNCEVVKFFCFWSPSISTWLQQPQKARMVMEV